MDKNRLFADKRKYLGKKSGEFRVMKQMCAGMLQQGLPVNAGEFSVIVIQKIYPASGKQACNADVQTV